MALGSRAISRLPGSGNGGFSGAKKLADLYAATNTNDSGEVKDPAVYDKIINDILSPYAGTVDGQNLIADYTNKKKKLEFDKAESDTTVGSLRQKEYSAWYVNDDGEDAVSFRNPAWVAQVTSESLDMILAEALDTRDKLAGQNKSTADIDSYITELSRRSERMRTVSTQLADGGEANLDGYGYYVDSDPNTGVIRGASFMPTDVNFNTLAENKIRTKGTVDINGKKVPVYLPYIESEDGTKKAMFGGTEYTGTSNLLEGEENVALTDRTKYSHALATIEMNKIYSTFTGKTNVDGSYKKDYIYVSPENKVYRFGEDDARGKELIDSMRNIAGVTDIPRLSPADARDFYSEPLPDDSAPIVRSATQTAKMDRFAREQAVYDAEVANYQNSLAGQVNNQIDRGVEGAKSMFQSVKSFFSRKNEPNKPDQPVASVNGQPAGNEVVAQGAGFFRNRA